jgi:D-glycero-alpha-D-manno-heptose 1-phosphate guanylyltransferase
VAGPLTRGGADLSEAIVLCGGLGTRLRSVISDVPKPMAPIAGRPFLDYVLAYLKAEGITRVVLAAGHKHDVISDRYGARWHGVEVAYSIEAEPLGTGGGLRQALELLESDHGLVLNGDSLLLAPMAMLAPALDAGADLVLTACWRADTEGGGVCRLDADRLLGFAAGVAGEGGLVNAGVYAMRRDLLTGLDLPAVFSFERDVLEPMASRLDVRVVISDAGFIDIGLPRTYAAAQSLLGPLADRLG